MYLQISWPESKYNYAVYTLTNQSGHVVHIGCILFSQLTTLPNDIPDGDYYLTVLIQGADRVKLLNFALNWCIEKNRDDLKSKILNIIPDESSKNNITCVETGERFNSITAAAMAHNLSYSALQKHLKGMKGYKTVKGKTYVR